MTVEEYENRGFTYPGKRRETPFFVNMRTMVGPIFDCGVGSMAHKGVLQPYLPFVLRITGFWDLRSTGDPPHNRRWGSVLMHGRCRMPLCGEFSGCNPPYRHLAHLPGLQFDILHAGTLPHEQCERFDFLASFVDEAGHAGADD